MKRTLFVLPIITALLIFSIRPISADRGVVKKIQPAQQIEAKKLDPRAKILSEYFAKYNSPLEFYAQDFIDAADQFNLDWKMVPAIAGVESTFGKFTPGGYNGWGWGVYGNQALYFRSWRDAIFTVSRGLRENYFNKGLTDPYSINRAYAASPYWGWKVTYFMNDIDKFSQNYRENGMISQVQTAPDKIAAASGLLAFK